MRAASKRTTAGSATPSSMASGNINVVANAGLGPTQYGLLAHAGDHVAGAMGAGNASVTYQ